MDSVFKNMDSTVKHWAPFPRRFPSAFPIVTTGFLREKDSWVRNTFSVCAFSLILRGSGHLIRQGKTWRVQAPCVFTQWPGDYLEYGPDETWDELFLIYDVGFMAKLQECRFVDLERPMWPIADVAAANAQIAEMELLVRSSTPELVVDRVDRICERIVLETWLTTRSMADGEQAIHTLLSEVRRDLRKVVDLEQEAAKHGMSLSTFRRRWAAISDIPPARYLQQLRIREACRLLVETNRPIYEIAHDVGFDDEFYFSRRLRKETQMAPREYRKTYQIRHSKERLSA